MNYTRIFSLMIAASLLASCTPDLKGLINSQLGKGLPAAGTTAESKVTTSPDPLEIASATGFSAESCSQEGKIKSGSGPATQMIFKNSSQGKIKIFWLDSSGKRIEYNKNGQQAKGNGGLDAGASFTQQTYITHPWLIANEQDQCQGIYTPTSATATTLEIKKTVIVSGSADASGSAAVSVPVSGTLTAANVTEERVRQGLACLKAQGKTSDAVAIEGLLNIYTKFKAVIGADLAAKGYLSGTTDTLNKAGC